MKCADLHRKNPVSKPPSPWGGVGDRNRVLDRNMIFLCRSAHCVPFLAKGFFGT